jgi:phospholipase/carboxylesterase
MNDILPCVEIEPSSPANASVIWLHGLGADGHDFAGVIPALQLPAALAIRFVLPHAPSMPVTVNNGYVMPAWYDIIRFGEEREFNRAQLEASAKAVHALIDREVARGVPSERIVLAGFSQGGAVCYEAALSYPQRLGGILGLSTYFPTADTVSLQPVQVALPILICHGSQDAVVPISMGRDSRRKLENLGFFPDFRTYVMAHEVCAEELVDTANFITTCVGSHK